MSYKVSIEIRFDAAHRLYRYEGKCQNLHGHGWTAVVEVAATKLILSGFVIDFGLLKTVVKDWIDTHWDHATILCVNDPLVQILVDQGVHVHCMDHEPTAEYMAECLFYVVGRDLQDIVGVVGQDLQDVVVTQVSIKETPTSTATYSI